MQKYAFTFRGRLARLSYVLQKLLVWVVMFFVTTLVVWLTTPLNEALAHAFVVILAVVWTLLSVMLDVRRLHDLDRSGWWCLLYAVPLVNVVLFLIVLFVRGTKGPNRYGPDPLAKPEASMRFDEMKPPYLG